MPRADSALLDHAATTTTPDNRLQRSQPAHSLVTLPAEGDGLVTDRVAAAALSIGRSTFWRWVAQGRIQPVRCGGVTRFRISDLRDLLSA